MLAAVATALTLFGLGKMTPRRFRTLHLLVFSCVIAIGTIAKMMYYV